MLKESSLHWRLTAWAINPTADSLFTQKNYNSSLLEVNNIFLVVLLLQKKKDTNSKYDGNIQKWPTVLVFCLRGTFCNLTNSGFKFSVQKHTSFPKGDCPNDAIPESRTLTTNLKGIYGSMKTKPVIGLPQRLGNKINVKKFEIIRNLKIQCFKISPWAMDVF